MEFELFDVNNIDDIKFIYLYNKYDISRYYPEILIHYGNDKTLVCDYSHPEFSLLIKHVYNLYLENPDITIFGKFDLEEVNKALGVGICHNSDLISNFDDLIKIWQDYVWIVIKDIIKILKPSSNIVIKGITGFKNKYVLNYKIDDYENMVSLICYFKYDGLDFYFSYLEDEVIPIQGKIRKQFGNLIIKYLSKDGVFSNSYVFPTSDNTFLDFKENIIYNEVTDDERRLINKYLMLCDLKECFNINKITDNSYIFNNYIKINNDECLVIDGEIYVSDEVYISYHEAYGLSSHEQYLFMPIDSYNVFCVLNDKKCICKYLPAKVCTGEYKNKVIAKTLIKK